MKIQDTDKMHIIVLKKNEERRIKEGHLWVFSNEIEIHSKDIENGELVEVSDYHSNFVGTGFYNRNSLIAVRIISTEQGISLPELLNERLQQANNLRRELYPGRESYRMVFSESDFLPGLIIDKYNNSYSLQVYSIGMEKNIEIITGYLKDKMKAENIFTRNEIHFRTLEGLPAEDKVYLGEMKQETINDGKLNYLVDFNTGHKTGFYFDQSDNREFIEKLVPGKRVLDAFCNSGGFGLHAVAAGASFVTFIDSSLPAIDSAKHNKEMNNITTETEFITGDIFEQFSDMIAKGIKYDVVIIDPPAFAKMKKHLHSALKGYEKLNRMAMDLISENGYLVTSSCSFHLKEQDFLKVIKNAASKAGKTLQMVHFNRASLDHPTLPAMEETSYLKFGVFKIS